MRKYKIWDNESSLVLGNGKLYDKAFINENFYVNNNKMLLIKEDDKVIEISPLSVYIEMMDIQETDETKILEYIHEDYGKEPEVDEDLEN